MPILLFFNRLIEHSEQIEGSPEDLDSVSRESVVVSVAEKMFYSLVTAG